MHGTDKVLSELASTIEWHLHMGALVDDCVHDAFDVAQKKGEFAFAKAAIAAYFDLFGVTNADANGLAARIAIAAQAAVITHRLSHLFDVNDMLRSVFMEKPRR